MRINKYVALATGMSRRKADAEIAAGNVRIGSNTATAGQDVLAQDSVYLKNTLLKLPESTTIILFNKPVGYVCSRDGQGSKTIYDLLPYSLHALKPVGRLDKDSSGLLLLTNDGTLAQQMTHPKYAKSKMYQICLNKPLSRVDWAFIHEEGIMMEDGLSKLFLERIEPFDDKHWQVTMHEGRNRQIRRTFAAVGYTVTELHRIQFGPYALRSLKSGFYMSPSTKSKSGNSM